MSNLTDRTLESLRHGTLKEDGRTLLLVCGVLSSLLYVVTTVLGAALWDEYSATSQTISELFAIDAPSSAFVVALFLVHNVLLIAFAVGVWATAGRKRTLRSTGVSLAGIGLVGSVATAFFPIHLRGAGQTSTDTMHAVLTGVIVALILLAVGFAAGAFGMWFRFYSLATLGVLVVFGVLAGLEAPRLAANEPTPWLGVFERVNIGAYLLWLLVLAAVLLRAQAKTK